MQQVVLEKSMITHFRPCAKGVKSELSYPKQAKRKVGRALRAVGSTSRKPGCQQNGCCGPEGGEFPVPLHQNSQPQEHGQGHGYPSGPGDAFLVFLPVIGVVHQIGFPGLPGLPRKPSSSLLGLNAT